MCLSVCVCVCVYVCVYGYTKVWVSGKMQSSFQQNMWLVYHAQNCPFLSTFETANLICFIIVITAFCESFHKINVAILRRSALQI